MRSFTGMLDGTFTTATPGGWFDMGSETVVAVHVTVTAISGASASATFVLEDSADGVNAANVVTSSAVTATGTTVLRSGTTPTGQFVRVRLSSFTGTSPSITVATKGRAVVL